MTEHTAYGQTLISVAAVALFLTIRHRYGAVIQYIYEEKGNLMEKRIVQTSDTTPPTGTGTCSGRVEWKDLVR